MKTKMINLLTDEHSNIDDLLRLMVASHTIREIFSRKLYHFPHRSVICHCVTDLFTSIPSTILDTYISTLVTANNSNIQLKSYCMMLDTLLELFFFPNTTVTTYVWALCTLLAAHKNHLVGWCARTSTTPSRSSTTCLAVPY